MAVGHGCEHAAVTEPAPPPGPDPDEEQLALLPAPARARAVVRRTTPPRERTADPVAEVDPVARVLVDVPLAHLDRPFDYAVPAPLAEAAQPGVRVKVRFAGQDVDGFVLERAATTTHTGRLQPLRRVVSAEPVLLPGVAALTGDVAARYAGTRSDVLRLAVPARHAAVEKQPPPDPAPVPDAPDPQAWAAYAGGPDVVAALAGGAHPGRCGRCCPVTTRRRCSPTPRWPRRPRAAARWCACPTAATSPASTPR